MMPATEPLTARQTEVLSFIVSHQAQTQRPPTRAEISTHFGWGSINSAETHVRALAKKGAIVLDKIGRHSIRNIRVPRAAPESGPVSPRRSLCAFCAACRCASTRSD